MVFGVGESLDASTGGSSEIGVWIRGGADVGFAFTFISMRVLGRCLVGWSGGWVGGWCINWLVGAWLAAHSRSGIHGPVLALITKVFSTALAPILLLRLERALPLWCLWDVESRCMRKTRGSTRYMLFGHTR